MCIRDRAIGTTRRGIGPAYEAKAGRRGVRVRDLMKPARLEQLVAANLDELTPVFKHLGGALDPDGVKKWIADAGRLCLGDADHRIGLGRAGAGAADGRAAVG